MSKERRKQFFNILLFAVVFALTVNSVFSGTDLTQLLTYLSSVNLGYILPSIVCVVLFILGESVIFHYLFRTLGLQSRFSHCCLYSFIGFFYSCITPSASGGQPMQLIAMRKDRLPAGPATVVLAIVTITYKLVLVLLGVVVMVLRPSAVMQYLAPVESIMYLGMVLNVVCIAALLLLVFHPSVIRSLTTGGLMLIHRIRPIKDLDRQAQRVENLIAQYQGAAEFYRSHKGIIVNVLLITIAQRFILFFVTWLTYLAFGLSGHDMLLITVLQGMIAVAADMLPLPGGMGVSETLFLQIFTPIFGQAMVLPGMVVSRSISFYTQLLISAVMTVAASFIIKAPKDNTGNG